MNPPPKDVAVYDGEEKFEDEVVCGYKDEDEEEEWEKWEEA
jgi:hypothetical protein